MKLKRYRRGIITALVVVVGGGLAFGALQAFNTDLNQATIKDFENTQKLFANITARNIERYFYDVEKRMQTIALQPGVRNAARSEACNQHLQDLLEVSSKEISNLGRIDKNGVFVCAVNRTIVGEPASKYGTYFDTIAKDPEHKPVMSPLIYPSGSASPVIAVHVAVYDSTGQFNGTVGGAVYFGELQQQILAELPSKKATIALYDNNLDILYSADPLVRGKNFMSPEVLDLYSPRSAALKLSEEFKKSSSEGITRYSLRDIPTQAVYKSVPVIGRSWSVVIAVPDEDMYTAVNRMGAKSMYGVALGVIVLAVGWLTFLLIRPLAAKKAPAKSKT